jgi:hypothetical protein
VAFWFTNSICLIENGPLKKEAALTDNLLPISQFPDTVMFCFACTSPSNEESRQTVIAPMQAVLFSDPHTEPPASKPPLTEIEDPAIMSDRTEISEPNIPEVETDKD